MIEFDIAPNTQIGRIDIANKVYENENVYGQDKYSRGGEFIENMVTDNHIEFCHRWFKLAGVMEFLQDMDEYSRTLTYGAQYSTYQRVDDRIIERPVYSVESDISCPVEVYDRPVIAENPVYRFDTLKDNNMSTDYEDIKAGRLKNVEGC